MSRQTVSDSVYIMSMKPVNILEAFLSNAVERDASIICNTLQWRVLLLKMFYLYFTILESACISIKFIRKKGNFSSIFLAKKPTFSPFEITSQLLTEDAFPSYFINIQIQIFVVDFK